MRRPLKAAFATALLLVTGGCAASHLADVAETPNPAPPPGYRVVCVSVPTILNGFTTSCAPVQGPVVVDEVAIQTKG
jgi:hypothetical protein